MPKRRGEQTPVSCVQLRAWYEDELLSTRQIAARMDVSDATVVRWLRRFGIAARGKREAAVVADKVRNPEIGQWTLRQLYMEDGLTVREVAVRLGVPKCRIEMLLKRHDIARRRSSYTKYAESRYEIVVDEDKVVADYEGKRMTIAALSRKYGMCDIWISKLLRRRGVIIRGRNQHTKRCSKAA